MSDMETVDRTVEGAGRRARSDVNGPTTMVFAGCVPCTMLCELSFDNFLAILKASDIFTRGVKMMNTAVVGSTWMAVDDAIAGARSAMSCQSLQQLVELETETAPMSIRRYLGRASILCRMATQLVEDALFPLERRFVLAFDLFGRNVH